MNKKILEKCNRSELREIGLLTQEDLAKYLGVCYRTTNRRINENENFCNPILVKNTKYYHPELVDKYCNKYPATREQIKKAKQKDKMEKAKNFLHEILKGEN